MKGGSDGTAGSVAACSLVRAEGLRGEAARLEACAGGVKSRLGCLPPRIFETLPRRRRHRPSLSLVSDSSGEAGTEPRADEIGLGGPNPNVKVGCSLAPSYDDDKIFFPSKKYFFQAHQSPA